MPLIDIPGKGLVEFPETMSHDEITAAARRLSGESTGEAAPKPTFLQALGGAAKERLGEVGQLPGDLMTSLKKVGATLGDKNLPLRMAPMTVPGAGPLATSAMNVGTEGLAQLNEGQFRPLPLALAALPAVLAGGARAARAGNRMATRMLPGKFAAAQNEAQGAAQDLVGQLTPDTQALYQQAEAAKGAAPPVDLTETGRVLSELRTQQRLAPALSPESEAARAMVEKVAPLDAPTAPLSQLDAYMRELNTAIRSRAPAKKTAELLSGAAVRDVERAAGAGNQGADLLRQAADAYKSQMGATRLHDLVTKHSPPLTGAGPALNMRALEKGIGLDKDLARLLGPEGMQQVQAYLERYRGLPPERMSTLATIGKGLLGSGSGGYLGNAIGGPAGAAIGGLAGALGPEYLQNLMFVGRNPAGLNQGLTLAGQALRPTLLDAFRSRQ